MLDSTVFSVFAKPHSISDSSAGGLPLSKSLKPRLIPALPMVFCVGTARTSTGWANTPQSREEHMITHSLVVVPDMRSGPTARRCCICPRLKRSSPPPSPLPQAIAFPGKPSPNFDLMGEDSEDSFGAFQSDTLAPAAGFPFPSAPALLQAPPATSRGVASMSTLPAPLHSSTAEKSKPGGGLSAQDLSFFEGL